MIYLIVLFLLLLLSIRYDINGRIKGSKQWYIMIQIILIIIAGLRFRFGLDTISYLYNFYNVFPSLGDLDFTRLDTFRYEPLWVLLNSTVKTLGGKFYIVQLIQASIVNILVFKYFKKHSEYPFLCVTLFFIIDYCYFCMMIMRNAVAIVICLFANDYVLEKKWKKAFLLFSIAFLFHYSTILFILATPFLLWLRLNKKGIIVILSMLVIGKIMSSYIGDLSALIAFNDTVSGKLDNYMDNNMLSTESKNINYFIFAIMFPFVYDLISLYFVKKKQPQSSLMKFEPFVMIGLMFVLLRMNIGMLHRFTKLYEIYFIMFYVQAYMIMYKRKGRLTSPVSLARAFIVFFPFLFTTTYIAKKDFWNYNPYYTVLEKKVEKRRDNIYLQERPHAVILNDAEY